MKPALALIIAGRGDLQDGLLTLMSTAPQVKTILIAENRSAAQRMLEIHNPSLVLLDMNLAQNEARIIFEQIKFQQPTVHCIAIADNAEQEVEAELFGADKVLLSGFQAAELIKVTELLLSQPNSDDLIGLNS